MNVFPLKSVKRQGFPHSLLLFNIAMKALSIAIRQECNKKDIQMGKNQVKPSLFADNIMPENTKDYSKN